MRWVAIIDDNQDLDWIRKEHSAAHFEYLGAHRDKIVIAGGLRSAPGEWPCGGLWVLEADSKSEVVKLIEGDPYFRLGLRKSYRVFVWGKAPLLRHGEPVAGRPVCCGVSPRASRARRFEGHRG